MSIVVELPLKQGTEEYSYRLKLFLSCKTLERFTAITTVLPLIPHTGGLRKYLQYPELGPVIRWRHSFLNREFHSM